MSKEGDNVEVEVNAAAQEGSEVEADAAVEEMQSEDDAAESIEEETAESGAEKESDSDGLEALNSSESTELEQAKGLAADYLDRMTRMQAEMDNLRKRTARDVDNARKFALERFARELLAVADSMDLGLTAAEDAEDVGALKEGMELTRKQLFDVLERFDIEVMDAMGVRFDPEQHEAMTMVPNPEMEPNTVMDVIQKGYTLNGRLLRPARVIVTAA